MTTMAASLRSTGWSSASRRAGGRRRAHCARSATRRPTRTCGSCARLPSRCKKTALGPNGEDARGGGCNACHLSYDAAALAALRRVRGAQGDGRAPTRRRAHPALSLDIGNGQCFGCHSRSGRISTSYEGWHEMHDPPAGASDPGGRAVALPRARGRPRTSSASCPTSTTSAASTASTATRPTK